MDVFGFSTQGINYDKFRPRYPLAFIQKCLNVVKNKNRYLDIATGTGQLLFAFSPYFQFSKGIDISKNMLENAQIAYEQFHLKNPQTKIQLEINNVMTFSESEKYDLITVGQALHFFPFADPLKRIKNFLTPQGCFVAFGYVPKQVISKNVKQDQLFNQFYQKVKPLFTIDRDDLHTFYEDKQKYPFDKIFARVQRERQEVPFPMNKLEYISYLRTMSGYNLYVQKNKYDPLQELSKVCADQVTIILYYFKISCYLS